MLPAETMVDGRIIAGATHLVGSQTKVTEQISDCWTQYNRGELHPMLVLADKAGKSVGSNPARPWMVNANVGKPLYG